MHLPVFGDQVFHKSVDIPMDTNCASLLADLYLYSYKRYMYMDDILSIDNHNFYNYVPLIYPDELKIKDTTESGMSASYLDIDSNDRL
jgi:hypothetical protein